MSDPSVRAEVLHAARRQKEAKLMAFAAYTLGVLEAHVLVDASEVSPSECVETVKMLIEDARSIGLLTGSR